MKPPQTNTTLTLEEVYKHFQQWRSTRKSQRVKIPDDLLAEAVSLLDRYSQVDILRKLGLSRKRLLSAASELYGPTTKKSEAEAFSTPFIQVPWPSPEPTIPCLELAYPNGMTLRLQDCNESLVAQMVNTFMDHSPCCK